VRSISSFHQPIKLISVFDGTVVLPFLSPPFLRTRIGRNSQLLARIDPTGTTMNYPAAVQRRSLVKAGTLAILIDVPQNQTVPLDRDRPVVERLQGFSSKISWTIRKGGAPQRQTALPLSSIIGESALIRKDRMSSCLTSPLHMLLVCIRKK
jgi:hypothetical protein